MLAGTLAYVVLVALIAVTILSTGLAMTRMTIERGVSPYIAAAYQRAAVSLQQTLATDMQGGGLPYPAPTFTPLPMTCANASCTYKTTEAITLVQSPPATPGAACDTSQSNCAPNVQTNAFITESRITAIITVNVVDAQDSTVAKRTGSVVLRTFDSPPYVAIAGAREGTFDDIAGSATAGDDGGAPPATPNPCASATASTSDDTTVRVQYRNAVTNACSDGSAWANFSYNSGGSVTGWSP